MEMNRRAILHLVAVGRISATEAERLLIAWNSGTESLWALTVLIAIAWLVQLNLHAALPALLHIAHSLMSGGSVSLHPTLALVARLPGGTL
jgi:hypothetical protein